MDEERERAEKLKGTRVNRYCPDGHQFVVRMNSRDGSLFLGCSEYPRCTHTDEIPAAVWMQLHGAIPLEGFE